MSDRLDSDRTIGEQWAEFFVRSVREEYAAELREAGQRVCDVCGESQSHEEGMGGHYHATVGYHVFVPGRFYVIPADALAGEDDQ